MANSLIFVYSFLLHYYRGRSVVWSETVNKPERMDHVNQFTNLEFNLNQIFSLKDQGYHFNFSFFYIKIQGYHLRELERQRGVLKGFYFNLDSFFLFLRVRFSFCHQSHTHIHYTHTHQQTQDKPSTKWLAHISKIESQIFFERLI